MAYLISLFDSENFRRTNSTEHLQRKAEWALKKLATYEMIKHLTSADWWENDEQLLKFRRASRVKGFYVNELALQGRR
jgi:hypothetical protein